MKPVLPESKMNAIEFEIQGIPIPKARARVTNRLTKKGKRITITPKRTKRAEADFITQAKIYAPREPFVGAVLMDTIFFLPIPKNWPVRKKQAALQGEIRPISTPDRDNLLKLVQDAMNGIFYRDDCQIVDGRTAKYYSDKPRIRVYLEKIEGVGL